MLVAHRLVRAHSIMSGLSAPGEAAAVLLFINHKPCRYRLDAEAAIRGQPLSLTNL
jgi:hypothetical protein